MTPTLQTLSGCAIPPAPRHSVTVHFPGWEPWTKIRDIHLNPGIFEGMHSMYPRVKIHQDIKALSAKILEKVGHDPENPQGCLIFASPEAAAECRSFGMDPRHGDVVVKEEEIAIRVFDVTSRYYAVFVPVVKMISIVPFWINCGMGISSRMGEADLSHIDLLREVTDDSPAPTMAPSPVHFQIQERVASLLECAPISPVRFKKVQPDDVYLFPSGMGALYSAHKYLLKQRNKSSVLFGFAFHSTFHVLEDIGPGFKFFGNGDVKDMSALETYLKAEAEEGRSVQALYTEFPANPTLKTPDLTRLRTLADQYGFALVVDDTIGSFCNIDVLGVADIVITSLTKSFSGYADVMAGCATLNPSSLLYSSLKPLFQELYINYLCNEDAEVLEKNSRDYLARSKILNNNALRLVEYLESRADDPKSSVVKVQYPTIDPSLANYHKYMRPATKNFTPGYGCLFSVEFEDVPATAAFYDNLNVHQGPHLGAHLTLAMPYVMSLYGHNKLDWIAPFGLKETHIRISAGLEETEHLLEDFKAAVDAADRAKES